MKHVLIANFMKNLKHPLLPIKFHLFQPTDKNRLFSSQALKLFAIHSSIDEMMKTSFCCGAPLSCIWTFNNDAFKLQTRLSIDSL